MAETPEVYRDRAAYFEALAVRRADPESKAAYRDLAAAYRRLVAQQERPKSPDLRLVCSPAPPDRASVQR
jgi:hypothetical protein